MLSQKFGSISFILILMLILTGCAGSRKIKTDDAYQRISPLSPLPQYLSKDQPNNLIVNINNVANESSSYKNCVELYVNNFLIEPEDEVTNVQSFYSYEMRLQPGVYQVQAKYFASTGWKIKTFRITSKENVMIFPDKIAKLKISLKKDSWGGLSVNPSYFDVSYDKIAEKEKE